MELRGLSGQSKIPASYSVIHFSGRDFNQYILLIGLLKKSQIPQAIG